MIRILHCVAGLERGGYETLIMNIYKKIDRTKVQFDFLYSFDGVFNQQILDMGGRIHQIPFITQEGPFLYRYRVMKFFREHPEYRIVHSHMDKFSGLIMECAKKNGVPVRISHSHGVKNEGGFLFDAVKSYYGKKVLPNCTHKFSCSTEAANFMFGSGEGVTFLKNGVDTARFALGDRRDPAHFTIVQIGRFFPVKNQSFMLDIFGEVLKAEPGARLYFAGSGKLMDPMKEKAKEMGIADAVTFLGDCNEIPELLSKADVLCMPSLYEAFSMTLLEAQSAGVPCVVSDTIAGECKLVEDFTFVPLTAQPGVWAEACLAYRGQPRKDRQKAVADAGYDIAATAKLLQDFYLAQNV